MFKFSRLLRDGALLLTISACVVACSQVRSQSSSADRDGPIRGPSPPGEVVPSKENDGLESVVRRYCEHARKGNLNEIKDLVELLPEYLPPRSNKTNDNSTGFSDNGLFAEIDQRALEYEYPEMIFTGKYYITKIIVASESGSAGKVEATLRSRVSPERAWTLIFSLHRKDSVWRIDGITFKVVDDMLKELVDPQAAHSKVAAFQSRTTDRRATIRGQKFVEMPLIRSPLIPHV